MRFTLPKPLHGWRQFAGEVGVIVLGVLVALGAQQIAEDWSWRNRARQATDVLREEVQGHFKESAEVVMAQPCIDQQLSTLEEQLDRSERQLAPRYFEEGFGSFVLRAPSRPWSDNKWRTINDEGVASHLAKDLRDNLGDHYGQVAIMREDNRAADQLQWRLSVLAEPVAMDAGARSRVSEEIAEARGRYRYMSLVGNQIMGRIRDMKLAPSQADLATSIAASGTLAFCRAHALPIGTIDPK